MKTMFRVMAEYSDYEGRYDRFDYKVGMVETIEQAHKLASENVTENNNTHATGRYQVIECTMDEVTFTYTEKIIFTDYTPIVKEMIKNRELESCKRCIARYTNEINTLQAKINKRIAQGKEPAKTWLKDIEMYQRWLEQEQRALNKIR